MEPPLEELKHRLKYDPETGVFTWRYGRNKGRTTGCKNSDGYLVIGWTKMQTQYAHRLAWLYVHGTRPKELDHINGDRTDNRISNLRPVTRSQNNVNSGLQRSNKSGFKGVSWDNARQKWAARISTGIRYAFLGYFDTKESASTAYQDAAAICHGNYRKAA
jgi:hypothetical protein